MQLDKLPEPKFFGPNLVELLHYAQACHACLHPFPVYFECGKHNCIDCGAVVTTPWQARCSDCSDSTPYLTWKLAREIQLGLATLGDWQPDSVADLESSGEKVLDSGFRL